MINPQPTGKGPAAGRSTNGDSPSPSPAVAAEDLDEGLTFRV